MNLYDIIEQKKKQILTESLTSDEFLDFLQKNLEPFETMLSYYRCAIMEIETKFKVLNEEFSLQYDRNPIESIKSRVKSMDSLMRKIRKKGIPISVESIEKNITDIAGVRVVCSFPEDIYFLADCLLQQDDIRLIKKKDYITNPKPSGYRSLHLIVEVPIFLQNEKRNMAVEVQLRTIAMDFWASVEHKLRYKKNIPAEQAEQLAEELMECANVSASLDFKMQEIRKRLAAAEVENEPEPTALQKRIETQLKSRPQLKRLETDLQKLQEKNQEMWKSEGFPVKKRTPHTFSDEESKI